MNATDTIQEEGRMSLRDHLEELRRRLLWSLALFMVMFFVGVVLKEPLVKFVLVPWNAAREGMMAAGHPDPGPLRNIGPAEPFIFTLKLAAAFALIGGAPLYLHQLWRFVGVGLLDHERKAVSRSFPVGVVLLLIGMAFGYRILLPLGLQFLVPYVPAELVQPEVTVSAYFSLVAALTVLMGFVFELPLIMWLVVRAGLVEVSTLSKSRRVAIITMLVFSAMMTPPDVVTQLLVTGPMIILYEIGLVMARRAERALKGESP
jgi:sec-independent protein translocase protein TatC